jgi:hypothetical protein
VCLEVCSCPASFCSWLDARASSDPLHTVTPGVGCQIARRGPV